MSTFRTCPTTGLKVENHADNLMRANAVVGVVALLIGGITAILVLLTRWQAVHLLNAEWFYRILTIHGMNMLIFVAADGASHSGVVSGRAVITAVASRPGCPVSSFSSSRPV